MEKKTVGISDMAIHVPTPRIALETILSARAAADPPFERRLRRAIESTGQISMRFPFPWEDPVTMAAQAGDELLRRLDGNRPRAERTRYVAVGTESSVDMSKPIAAYLQGALQRSGVSLPRELSTFQVQHACAGGTIALVGVAALLQAAGRPGECGLVTCTDVARYQTPSTAEITQGAGAVAMLVEEDPQILELDLTTMGLASSDVDDFFRPLGSITARVKGRYSVDCYNESLNTAFLDHCSRVDRDPKDVLKETDLFVVHVPFHRMAITGMSRLVERHLGTDPSETKDFLAARHFEDGIEAVRHIGNTYSASAYVTLMYTLWERYRADREAIVGSSVLIASYGSGNTMTVVSGRVAENAPAVLDGWDLTVPLNTAEEASMELYEEFVREETYNLSHGPVSDGSGIPPGRYYLAEVREDGYRRYEHTSA
jgi:hydroxymethylglutaryl-CoA synthase